MSKYNNVVLEAYADMVKLEKDSEKYACLNDFTELFKKWKQKAYEELDDYSEYNKTIKQLEDIIDDSIRNKLKQHFGSKVMYSIQCMELTKNVIYSKYVRYRLFSYCYAVKGNNLVLTKDGRITHESLANFLDFIEFTYLSLKYLFRTENKPINTEKGKRKLNITWHS